MTWVPFASITAKPEQCNNGNLHCAAILAWIKLCVAPLSTQTRELLSTNAHFQLQKLVQFCFCLNRTAMHLRQCCMAATTFVGYCKCSVVQICNEQCTTRCRNNFHLSLAVSRANFKTNIVLLCSNWF